MELTRKKHKQFKKPNYDERENKIGSTVKTSSNKALEVRDYLFN